MNKKIDIVCIGAGPAGLTAAYLLSKENRDVCVLEMDQTYVGGIARTVKHKGFSLDVGGHRFFSKSREIEALWDEILPTDMIFRDRSSRIYYRNQFYSYPLKGLEALLKLGIIESIACVLSYLKANIIKNKNIVSFEDWVSDKFGKRLYSIFFKTYTEKVWGISCKEISADWAAQRIKGLSLITTVIKSLIPQNLDAKKDRTKVVKTLIRNFRYPRKGPGMMWEEAQRKIISQGGEVLMGMKVVSTNYDKSLKKWFVYYEDKNGEKFVIEANHVISTMPLKNLMLNMAPKISAAAKQAANNLSYRAFLTVALMVKSEKEAFKDNWIYIHDPILKVGRVQNFKSWSPELVPGPEYNCYGLEYFCFEEDDFWNSPDQELITLAKEEMVKLGLVKIEDIFDAVVVRQEKAYPVYDQEYKEHLAVIQNEIEEFFPNLHLVGRNGMHRYNNQDHAMMTAMLASKNIISRKQNFDIWRVNEDAEYHEESKSQ